MTTGNRSTSLKRSMPSRSAPALPTFCRAWIALTPQRSAILSVSSVDPSDTTWTFLRGTSFVIAAMLSAMTAASL
jgi:hypothetical protein